MIAIADEADVDDCAENDFAGQQDCVSIKRVWFLCNQCNQNNLRLIFLPSRREKAEIVNWKETMSMKSFLCAIAAVLCVQVLTAGESVIAVRGVWLTNVDSNVLNSKKNIEDAVALCSETGINAIFVVTWNKTMTTYPSAIMKRFTGVEIDTQFTGRDPLRELIDAAHAKNIKVIAWFEYGFAGSYQENGGKLIRLNPEWASRDAEGKLVSKNGFEWMNGFRPDVQDFILSLIMEVVQRYPIDGIQGDDRLPAMPSEGGYDAYTVGRYRAEHYGQEPPADCRNTAWIQWRADIMNAFMKRLYNMVKGFNKSMLVTMAPSIYPWSKQEYLQDWPAWINGGYVDLVIPQVYRYESDSYCSEQQNILTQQIDRDKRHRYYPGILLKVGSYYPSEEFLKQMIEENRRCGIQGEVFFFYEGLKRYPAFFKTLYKEHADFPSLAQ